jgi:hypothetical protein
MHCTSGSRDLIKLDIAKFYSLKKNNSFDQKCQYIHDGCPNYRISLHPSKENLQSFKTLYISSFFFFFVCQFCIPGSGSVFLNANVDPDPADAIHCGSGSGSTHWYKDKATKQMLNEGRIVMIYLHSKYLLCCVYAVSSLSPLLI